MKKLCLTLATAALFISFGANAETAKGKVIDQKGNMMTIQMENGDQMTMMTTDKTTYRKKKMVKHDMTKNGKMYPKGTTYYKPIVDEDDWIEVVYTPAQTSDTSAIVEDVVVYDD